MDNLQHEGMKKCSKCGEWKPATEEWFYRDRDKKGGFRVQCKVCRAGCEYVYRQKNKDKIAESKRKCYQKNKDKIAESRRKYRQKNKDKIAESKRKYRQKNKDKIAESKRKCYQKNKDKVTEYHRKYCQTPVGRLAVALLYARKTTGADIYLRDLPAEMKIDLANERIKMLELNRLLRDMKKEEKSRKSKKALDKQ